MYGVAVSDVYVRQVTAGIAEEIIQAYGGRGLDGYLGGSHSLDAIFQEIQIQLLRSKASPDNNLHYYVEWTGSNVARGLEIEGKKIVGMQNGVIMFDDHSDAAYERLGDQEAQNGRRYSMIVTTKKPR